MVKALFRSLLPVMILLLVACGGDRDTATPPAVIEPTYNPPVGGAAAPAGGAPTVAAGVTPIEPTVPTGNIVTVTLNDYDILMPPVLPPGLTTFRISNSGTRAHNFKIMGQGIEQQLDADLEPLEVGELKVNLQPGTYRLICPIANHEQLGMTFELKVE